MNRTYVFVLIVFISSCHSRPRKDIIEKWENGKSKVAFTYDNPSDTLSYLREDYYKNGKLSMKGSYINGFKDGLWQWWFENGNKQDEAIFKHDAYIKERKHWREDGKQDYIEIIDGECISECCDGKNVMYDKNGVKLVEYTMKNGAKNGAGVSYYPNGKIRRKFIYVNGKKEGETVDFDEAGRIASIGNFKDDKSDGLWITKDSLGRIVGKFIDKDDMHNGIDSEFYANGKLRTTGLYINDKEEGKWTFYDITGKIEGWHYYKNGNLIKKVKANT